MSENTTSAILSTIKMGAITYALENAEAFRAWMVKTAEDQGEHEVAENLPPLEVIELTLAVAGMSVIESAERAGLVPPADELVSHVDDPNGERS